MNELIQIPLAIITFIFIINTMMGVQNFYDNIMGSCPRYKHILIAIVCPVGTIISIVLLIICGTFAFLFTSINKVSSRITSTKLNNFLDKEIRWFK